MSKADIRSVEGHLSGEQLETLTKLETEKRDSLVQALVTDLLADEYEKLEYHFRRKKIKARESSSEFHATHKSLGEKSNRMFKQYDMKKMN